MLSIRDFFLQIDTSARLSECSPALRQGQIRPSGEHKSSPRPGARDGMKREPYELRVLPSRTESKGQATNGDFKFHAFPGFSKLVLHRRYWNPAVRRGSFHTIGLP